MILDIMLPYWGDEDRLFEAVESVRAQTDPEWRLTVIDDAYPSERVPAYFAQLSDARVSYARNESNEGIVANFRRSAELATSQWMSIFGCDDVLDPGYVACIKSMIQAHPDVDILQPGVRVIDAEGRTALPLVDRVKQRLLAPRTHDDVVLAGADLATSLIRGNWLYWPSLVFRTETVRRVGFADLPIILDLDMLMKVAFDGGSLAYRPKPVVFGYRRHSGSASQTSLLDGRRFRDERDFYQDIVNRARMTGWRRTAGAARLRLMSRLHAVTEAPRVLRHGSKEAVRALLAHVFAS